MKIRSYLLTGISAALLALAPAGAQQAAAPAAAAKLVPPAPPAMPKTTTRAGKHINRMIDIWMKDEPVYYTSTSEGGYENGKKMAATKADYINYGMESGPLDFKGLADFMRGLADAGPTRSGHRFPAVVVELPIAGTLEAMKANQWMVQQALATGIQGILLCNAESPEAVRLMIQAARYPFAPAVKGIPTGTRGNGSQNFAARIWGVTPSEYMRIAEPWPLNPDGEFVFGVKIENPRADNNSDAVLAVPGLSFVEHGPGDNGFNFLGRPGSPEREKADTKVMDQIRAKVFAGAKRNHLHFLSGCSEATVEALIKEGIRICTGGDTAAQVKGRAFTKYSDPW